MCPRIAGVYMDFANKNSFLVINVFHRGPYGPPLRSNWAKGFRLLLERGPYQQLFFIFRGGWGGGGPDPMPLPGSTHALENWVLMFRMR